MNKHIKKKWLAALRGKSPQGEYIQGKYEMCRQNESGQDTFCCLGVLRNEMTGFTQRQSNSHLSSKELETFGLTPADAYFLMGMNDELSFSFRRIAKWIEENL